ncbi:MAG: dihydropteroate synthase [Candidatus Omnitrophica bacterium]|nr:dihydropteroate synthase [Candidatus Omnitrophota bacterium]
MITKPETLQQASKRQKKEGLRIAWSRFSLDLDKRTYVMGVLNRTPDSFSDGGKYMSEESAVSYALNMARDGADIIDIGGESTRPGALPVDVNEELGRVIPVIKRLKALIDIPISIDTSKSHVAKAALENGASMVNDITGLKGDRDMAGVVARFDVPICIMHMKGSPRTMQISPQYDDLIGEIIASLRESIDLAAGAGIDEKKIIIDPGIGFGKTLEHNLKIIKELRRLTNLGRPILIGPSRKSFIGQILNSDVSERLTGTSSSVALAISNGANIVRVHDVREMVDCARVADSICRA